MYKKEIKFLIICITFFSVALFNNCFAENNVQINKISNQQVEEFKFKRTFIVKFTNIIYHRKGKDIKIPIFQGTYGDLSYKNFLAYCRDKKFIEPDASESAYVIKCKKGKIKETLHEFLAFYKSNILKDVDINNPTDMGISSTGWVIKYDFIIEGIPCTLQIDFEARKIDEKRTPEAKSVYDIIPEENIKDPFFFYTFEFPSSQIK